jgi:hypothetical protein
MVGPQQISFGEVVLLFICQEHSVFHPYSFNECSLFLELHLAFNFRLDLCLDIVISFHQGVFLPMVYIGFHQTGVIRPICITILYHNLLLFIDIFHI